jgi:hypothetical protein
VEQEIAIRVKHLVAQSCGNSIGSAVN